MALKKNLALMAVSTGSRLASGLIAFSMLARQLGPESFGTLMLWLSIAVLLALITNYGLTPYVLREIGASPAQAETVVNEGFTGKLLLLGPVVVISMGVVAALNPDMSLVFALLLAGTLADSFSEFFNAGFRARDTFSVETRIATAGAIFHACVVGTAVYVSPTLTTAALAYCLSRVTILCVTSIAVTRVFARPRLTPARAALARLRSAISYALDFGMQSLFGQVDSVVLNHFLGPVAVGLHQAGMRLFMGLQQAAPILGNVFLPRAAAQSRSREAFGRECKNIQFAFLATGGVLGVALSLAAKPIVNIMFGPEYRALQALLPLFGLLLFLRFAAASWGLILTASGHQRYRTWTGLLHWIVVGVSCVLLVPDRGVSGWLLSLCVGTLVLGTTYGMRARLLVDQYWPQLGLTFLFGLAFLHALRP